MVILFWIHYFYITYKNHKYIHLTGQLRWQNGRLYIKCLKHCPLTGGSQHSQWQSDCGFSLWAPLSINLLKQWTGAWNSELWRKGTMALTGVRPPWKWVQAETLRKTWQPSIIQPSRWHRQWSPNDRRQSFYEAMKLPTACSPGTLSQVSRLPS